MRPIDQLSNQIAEINKQIEELEFERRRVCLERDIEIERLLKQEKETQA